MSNSPQRTYDELVIEYLVENTHLETDVVSLLVNKSFLMEILKEDEQFVGHYPPEFWGQQVLDEWSGVLKETAKHLCDG